jgi:hypothetical protein
MTPSHEVMASMLVAFVAPGRFSWPYEVADRHCLATDFVKQRTNPAKASLCLLL